jgi:hypothetical protein
MIKVLFLLECDECRMPNTTVLASNQFDAEQWTGWIYEMPLVAERFSGWKIDNDIHLCPICYEEIRYWSDADCDD